MRSDLGGIGNNRCRRAVGKRRNPARHLGAEARLSSGFDSKSCKVTRCDFDRWDR